MYKTLSAMYYDVSKPIGTSLEGDLEFYLELIKDKNHILECGSGTGRLLIPYLEKGLDIEGVEPSSAMRSICENHLKETAYQTKIYPNFFEKTDFSRQYDAIIIPTGTFCLFTDIEKTIVKAAEILEDEGLLAFDLIYPYHFILGHEETYQLSLNDKEYVLLEHNHYAIDMKHQKTHEIFTYTHFQNGQKIASEKEDFILYWHKVDDIIALLEKHSFKIKKVLSKYQSEKITNEDALITVVSVRI